MYSLQTLWYSFAASPGLAPAKLLLFNSSHSCVAVHLLQKTILACSSSILFTSCGQTTLMSTATCPSNSKVCHCSHWMPKSRVFVHDCSCKSCYLFPSLHLKDLLRPCLLLLLFYICSSTRLPPKNNLQEKRQREAKCQRLVLSTLSQGPNPSSTTSSLQSLLNSYDKMFSDSGESHVALSSACLLLCSRLLRSCPKNHT